MQRKKILNRFGRTGDTAPSSFRRVFVRNIGAAPTPYSTQKPCGMTSVGTGFTLIELLVVVLIIGILAAAAVPQYQKAVWKSRTGNMLTLTRSLATAQQAYFMANGTYATRFDELDLGFDNLETVTTSPFGTTYLASNNALRKTNNFELRISAWGGGVNAAVSLGSLYLTGPYIGSGFVFMPMYPAQPSLEGRILCAEQNPLIAHPGDFCVRVVGCAKQKLFDGGITSYYELPY